MLIDVLVDLCKLSDEVKKMLLKRLNMIKWLKKLMLLTLQALVIQLKNTDYDPKTSEIEEKHTDHDHNKKYITTQKLNKLTSEHFAARLKETNLATETDIADFVKKARF